VAQRRARVEDPRRLRPPTSSGRPREITEEFGERVGNPQASVTEDPLGAEDRVGHGPALEQSVEAIALKLAGVGGQRVLDLVQSRRVEGNEEVWLCQVTPRPPEHHADLVACRGGCMSLGRVLDRAPNDLVSVMPVLGGRPDDQLGSKPFQVSPDLDGEHAPRPLEIVVTADGGEIV
jgi:hypothetical protein